jgi:membrane-bound metal-dependent hydrolase YbcI (DUF457 family)
MLVGAGAAEVVRNVAPLPRGRAWLTAAALAVAPDLDFILVIFLGRGGTYHGTFTHSLTAVAVVALLAWLLAGGRWALLAATGYGSHLLVDLLDDRGRTNVLLGWPFTHQQPFAIARIFPQVPFNPGYGMRDALLSLFSAEVLWPLAVQTAIGAALFLGLLALARGVRWARERA